MQYQRNNYCFSIVALLILLAGLVALPAGNAMANEKITLTDLAGRQVSLQVPVKSVVLAGGTGSGNPFFTLFALLGDDAAKTIVGMDQGLKRNRQWIWQKYLERYPLLGNIPDVGKPAELNVEKIIALKPDVVMATKGGYKGGKASFETLQKAGIPVILNDYHSETLDTHIKSMEMIGKVVGRPQRTKELVDFYKAQCAVVEDRLAKVSVVKPRIYVECGLDSKEYRNSYNKSMWGLLISRAGGANIAKGLIEGYGPISPEFVIKANPQVVVLTGANWPGKSRSLKLGYEAEQAEAKERLRGFLSRPGWNRIEAVKNRRVYGIHHVLSREIWDFYSLQCLAKWLYPDLFKDLNPLKNYKEFHEKFLGVEYSGVWAVQLD
jgi:iron complex transport system substrate-binding protein